MPLVKLLPLLLLARVIRRGAAAACAGAAATAAAAAVGEAGATAFWGWGDLVQLDGWVGEWGAVVHFACVLMRWEVGGGGDVREGVRCFTKRNERWGSASGPPRATAHRLHSSHKQQRGGGGAGGGERGEGKAPYLVRSRILW